MSAWSRRSTTSQKISVWMLAGLSNPRSWAPKETRNFLHCMSENRDNDNAKEPSTLVEGTDFYYDKGLMVLTAHFLRKRGFCCGSGCRHCPYPDEERAAALKKKLL